MKRLAIVISALFVITSCQPNPLERVKQQVSIGMIREEALEAVNGNSWYHQFCPNKNSIDDLFFFGDHRYNKASVVIVTSTMEGGVYRVAQVSSLETQAWQTAYQDCIEKDRFAK
jgi:hypothetical protein